MESDQCTWILAWNGMCINRREDGSCYCEFHSTLTCCICGDQATRDCDDVMETMVCHVPLCNSVECYIEHVEKHHGVFDDRTDKYQDRLREAGEVGRAEMLRKNWELCKEKLRKAVGL